MFIEGCTHAIIVHLNHQGHSNKKWRESIPNIIEIKPSEDLGNFLKGTLDFSPEGTKKRIDLGKKDAEKQKEKLLDFLKAFQSEENEIISKPETSLEEQRNIEEITDNVACLKCRNKFRIKNFPGQLFKEYKSDYTCPNCSSNILMRISFE